MLTCLPTVRKLNKRRVEESAEVPPPPLEWGVGGGGERGGREVISPLPLLPSILVGRRVKMNRVSHNTSLL